jgi:hypothetical protein
MTAARSLSGPAIQAPERTAYLLAACARFRLAALAQGARGAHDELAELDDAEVGRPEMLPGAVLDRALAVLDGGVLLAHTHDACEALALLLRAVEHVVVADVAQRHVVGVDLGVQAEALDVFLALRIGERPVGQPAVGVDPAVHVIDRHPALAVIDVARESDRHQRVVGHQELGDAPVLVGRVGLARRADDQPGVVARNRELRPRVVHQPANAVLQFLAGTYCRGAAEDLELGLLVLRRHLVQEGEMGGVDRALETLNPIAVLPLLGNVATARRHQAQFELRERGHVLARAHVDPDHVGPFSHRIGEQLDGVLVGGLGRRGREVYAVAVDVEFPAMIGAAQAAPFVAAVVEIGAAMRTVRLDDADATVAVAERQQVFTEDLDLLLRAVALGQFLGEQRRHPEAAQQVAHRRARPAAGQEFIVLATEHQSPRPY